MAPDSTLSGNRESGDLLETTGVEDAPRRASVIIPTLSRPSYLGACLAHLARQSIAPVETIVVDASPDDATYRLVQQRFPDVRYLRNPFGAGRTGMSRNLGLSQASGDVVAFVDDDAYADPDWLERHLETYSDPTVGGVGGRASNGVEDEERRGTDEIGVFRRDGTLTGNFAADPGHLVDVDHVLGANMSFRRDILVRLGGIRDGYPGTCLREETDLAFRVRGAGWRLVYNPAARVLHVAAPYPRGKRFDVRYDYYAHRNHVVLLSRTVGPTSPQLRRYLGVSAHRNLGELKRGGRALGQLVLGWGPDAARTAAAGVARAASGGAGTLVGYAAGLRQRRLDAARGSGSGIPGPEGSAGDHGRPTSTTLE